MGVCGSTETPLRRAVQSRDLEEVKRILAQPGGGGGVDPNEQGEDGETPLHVACKGSRVKGEIVSVLLAAKADPDAKSRSGITPLHWVAVFDNSEIVPMLLAAGADQNVKVTQGPSPSSGKTALQIATDGGAAATVEALLVGAPADVSKAMIEKAKANWKEMERLAVEPTSFSDY